MIAAQREVRLDELHQVLWGLAGYVHRHRLVDDELAELLGRLKSALEHFRADLEEA